MCDITIAGLFFVIGILAAFVAVVASVCKYTNPKGKNNGQYDQKKAYSEWMKRHKNADPIFDFPVCQNKKCFHFHDVIMYSNGYVVGIASSGKVLDRGCLYCNQRFSISLRADIDNAPVGAPVGEPRYIHEGDNAPL